MWQYHIFTIVIEAFVKVDYLFFYHNISFRIEKKCCPPNRLNNFIKDILLKRDFI